VITGGAKGIGLAVARRFAQAGMNVVISDIDDDALAVAPEEISSSRVLAVNADVSNQEAMDRLRDAAIEAFGAVDVLCCNAGIGGSSPVSAPSIDVDGWRRVFDVNVFGVLHGLNAFLPTLRARPGAHIFITASRTGLVPTPFTGAYGSSKFAAVALGEMLAAELEQSNEDVAVTIVCPGAVHTNLASAGRASGHADPRTAEIHRERAKTAVSAELVAEHFAHALTTRQRYVITHPVTTEWMQTRLDAIAHDSTQTPSDFVEHVQ